MDQRIKDVERLCLEGKTTRQIATELGLTYKQVDHVLHRQRNIDIVKKWYDNNPDYIKTRYNNLKEMWLPKGTKCVHCGKDAQVRHHKVYGEKEFAMKEIYVNRHTITDEMIEAEILKTVPLCIKCHRQIHLGVIIDPDLYSGPIQIVDMKENGHFNGVHTKGLLTRNT